MWNFRTQLQTHQRTKHFNYRAPSWGGHERAHWAGALSISFELVCGSVVVFVRRPRAKQTKTTPYQAATLTRSACRYLIPQRSFHGTRTLRILNYSCAGNDKNTSRTWWGFRLLRCARLKSQYIFPYMFGYVYSRVCENWDWTLSGSKELFLFSFLRLILSRWHRGL